MLSQSGMKSKISTSKNRRKREKIDILLPLLFYKYLHYVGLSFTIFSSLFFFPSSISFFVLNLNSCSYLFSINFSWFDFSNGITFRFPVPAEFVKLKVFLNYIFCSGFSYFFVFLPNQVYFAGGGAFNAFSSCSFSNCSIRICCGVFSRGTWFWLMLELMKVFCWVGRDIEPIVFVFFLTKLA